MIQFLIEKRISDENLNIEINVRTSEIISFVKSLFSSYDFVSNSFDQKDMRKNSYFLFKYIGKSPSRIIRLFNENEDRNILLQWNHPFPEKRR